MELPNEISEKIYYFYISLYMKKFEKIHKDILNIHEILYKRRLKKFAKQLLYDTIYLNLSEELFDLNIEFIYVERLPLLI